MKFTNKKLWTLLIAVLALVALCAFAAGAETVTGECGENGDNLTWSYDTETKTLTISGEGEMADYEFEGSNVPPWLIFRQEMETVQISEGVTSVGNAAFYIDGNDDLSTVVFPESLTRIGQNAFTRCRALGSITIPKNVVTACQAFVMSGLTSVTFENGLTKIDGGMFLMTQLQEVVIPNSVETIGTAAFSGCSQLRTIRVGTGVQTIGYGAFNGAPGLSNEMETENISLGTIKTCMNETEWAAVEKNVIDPDDPFDLTVKSMLFGLEYKPDATEEILDSHVPDPSGTVCIYCGKLLAETSGTCGAQGDNLLWNYNAETKTLTISGTGAMADYGSHDDIPWKSFKGELEAISLGNGITSICDYAFSDCSLLESIDIPDGVTTIGDSAFYSCESLAEVTLPESLTDLGWYAFEDCVSLKHITIPAGLTSGTIAFVNSGLESVTLQEGLEYIPLGLFTGSQLKNVVVPNSVKRIGAIAFGGCPKLETVQLGNGITSIGVIAFCSFEDLSNSSLETIRTCMTQEEWEQAATSDMTKAEYIDIILEGHEEEAGDLPDIITAEMLNNLLGMQLSVVEPNVEIVYEAHQSGEPVRETVPATADTPAHIDSVTYCAFCGGEMNRETVEILDAHRHDFTIVWRWSDDGTMADADGACSGCDAAFMLHAAITREPLSNGYVRCTATVTYDGQAYTDTKIVQPGSGGGSGSGGSGGSGGGNVAIKGRCSMCALAENYKNVPVAGWIIAIVHFFVHLASQISHR